jgi:hypothetical protein
VPEDNSINNKQIFYLTFDNSNDESVKEEALQVQVDNTQDSIDESVSYNETDVKLITLEDGRIFMTTGWNHTKNKLDCDKV